MSTMSCCVCVHVLDMRFLTPTNEIGVYVDMRFLTPTNEIGVHPVNACRVPVL